MDPKHWAKDLPAEVREVLDAGASLSAPNGAKQAVWSALATKLPAAAAGASAGGLTALAIMKPLAVGLLFGAVATAGVVELRSRAAPSPRSSASVSTSATPAPTQPRPTDPPSLVHAADGAALDPLAPARSLKAAPTSSRAEELLPSDAQAPLAENAPSSGASAIAAFPDQAPGAAHEDATVLESRRLNQARATLHAGDARRALAQLDAIAVDFPRGVLVQELDALRIEALLELGERQRARELARRFLERHPQSPHAAAVERALH